MQGKVTVTLAGVGPDNKHTITCEEYLGMETSTVDVEEFKVLIQRFITANLSEVVDATAAAYVRKQEQAAAALIKAKKDKKVKLAEAQKAQAAKLAKAAGKGK